MGVVQGMQMPRQSKLWTLEECPACNSTNVVTDRQTEEIICMKCGLVIY